MWHNVTQISFEGRINANKQKNTEFMTISGVKTAVQDRDMIVPLFGHPFPLLQTFTP